MRLKYDPQIKQIHEMSDSITGQFDGIKENMTRVEETVEVSTLKVINKFMRDRDALTQKNSE